MRAHAERWFALNTPDEKGVTYRELLEGLLKRPTLAPGARAEYERELECPPLPAALAYLWMVYRRLRRRKGAGFGIQPIEWPDIDAFLRNARMILSPWELEVIEDIDDAFLIANAPKKTGEDKEKD